MGRPKGSKNGTRTLVKCVCVSCGQEFEVRPYRANTAKYCSNSCKGRERWKGEGNPNYQGNKGPNNPRWKGGAVEKTCLYCGETYSVCPSKVDKRKTCSKECAWKYRRKKAGISGPTKREFNRTHCKVCGLELNGDQKTYCSWDCAGSDLSKGQNMACPICGEIKYVKPAHLKHWTACSQECLAKFKSESGMFAGENNPAWRGGYHNYYGPNWPRQRRKARKRDDYTCQRCCAFEEDQEHDVHHIIPFREFGYVVGENEHYKLANKVDNLLTLCRSCHVATENRR